MTEQNKINKLKTKINLERFEADCNLMTIEKLAIKYKVGTASIVKWRKLLGLNTRFKEFDTQEEIESFKLNYNKMNYSELAKLYNVNKRTIGRWAEKIGLNESHPFTIIDKENFKQEYQNSKIIDLAKKYNVSRKTIREWKEKLHLEEKVIYRNKEEILNYLESIYLKADNINEYTGTNSALICTTNLGFKVKIRIRNLLDGHLPQIFETSNPYTYENINLYCKIYRPDYILLEKEYLGSNKRHTFEYIGNDLPEKSNSIFKLRLDSFKMGVGHPDLTRSKGELAIQFLLDEYNIKYKNQYIFDDLRGKQKRHYKFDFGILEDNNKLLYLIEWDSPIHYKQIDFYGDANDFKERIERDIKKNNYCINNNIPLIRITEEYGCKLSIDDIRLETSKYLIRKDIL